ncbi:MAG: beta-ketoacyl synthase chain length factor [Bacteroidales bacterium]|nr:beta-ketoacyl synthase chain length factor [Bacteroidales bacterium]
MNLYIQAASQISIQEPLCEDWFEHPIFYEERYQRAIDPDFKMYIPPMVARRMGKLLKRALVTSSNVVENSATQKIDAIITGSGLGCIENTEKFLQAMVQEGEDFLQPTFFMQSTHNTISSQIALHLKCHGYNSTYSHRGTSFESGLLDAFQQISLQRIDNALVGGHDEMTPDYFTLLDQIGYWKKGAINSETLRNSDSDGSFSGETSVSFMIENRKKEFSLCEIKAVDLLYKPSIERMQTAVDDLLKNHHLTLQDIDSVFVGISGDVQNDTIYRTMKNKIFQNRPLCWYKHLFGESFSASGLGMYAAAICLQKNCIPEHLFYHPQKPMNGINNILVYNHFQNKDHSLILLSSC